MYYAVRCLLVGVVVAAVLALPRGLTGQTRSVAVWVTTGDRALLLARTADVPIQPVDTADVSTVQLFPSQLYQRISGFGASLTESAAYVLRSMPTDAARRSLMERFFERRSGIGLNFLRQPIGASDFALDHYSYNDLPPGQTDLALQHFSIDRDQLYVLPALKEAFGINPEILIMASPWSAPGWMKTSGSMVDGWLRSDRYAPFANYFVKFIQAYQAEGIPIAFVTVANEPLYLPKDYPGMYMRAPEQALFIRDHLAPALARAGLGPRVLTFDHNWSQAQYALEVLQDSGARQYVAGSAFHCYAGQPALMEDVHAAFPAKELHVTECSSFSTGNSFGNSLLWNARTLLIGSLRHWAQSIVLWNLVLDEHGGPRTGGCPDCTGLATVNRSTGAVTFNGEFYALAHASKFIARGARRIGSSPLAAPDLDAVAFKNPDGSLVVLIANTAVAARSVRLRLGNEATIHQMPPRSVATMIWPAGASLPGDPFVNPITVPGVVEAEDFAAGTAGVAYYDTSPGNFGGHYRRTDVDIEVSRDAGGGYNVGWIRAGEWMTYALDVTAAGVYAVEARVASHGTGGTFHVEIDGVDRSGKVPMPNTGGWQAWTTVRLPDVTLAAGRRMMRFVADANGPSGDVGNLNLIRLTPKSDGGNTSTPYPATPSAVPGRIEAEIFDNGGGGVAYYDVTPENHGGGVFRQTAVDIQTSVEGNYNIGWMAPGEWLLYSVNVASAGNYRLELRVAANGSGGRLHVEFDGIDKTGTMTVPNTGGWQTWTTISAPVTLSAGVQRMRVVVDAAGAEGVVGNLNYIALTATTPPTTATDDLVIYAADIPSASLRGGWSIAPDVLSPVGMRLQTPDAGFSTVTNPSATPVHYMEATFTPLANIEYRVWLRLKAANDNKYNDSAWVQFSGARHQGAGVYAIGSTHGLLVNLATDAAATSLRGWGWANGAYWLAQPTTVTFPQGGPQTIRIQVREDGVQLDHIVLSPRRYFATAPGPPGGDATIVAKTP